MRRICQRRDVTAWRRGYGAAVQVGRARELAVLDRAVTAALAGGGSVVLLGGEPGIGKTTLAAEGQRRAVERGLATGWGGCPSTGAAPFLPWRSALGQVCPEAAAALAAADGGAQDARFRLFEQVATELAVQAGRTPLLVVLDDLQWADPASVQLLRFLLRSLRTCRVVVVATYRDAEVDPEGALAAIVEEMAGAGAVVRMTGLGPAEVEALAASRGAPAPDVALLHGRTGGNPFLVEQLCDLGDFTSAVPPAVASLLQRRLRGLPGECRELLEVAAVAGRTVELPIVAEVTGRPVGELLTCVDRAVGARVLRPVAHAPDYAFVHDLMREAVVTGLAAGRLADLHVRCGTALARREERLDEAARHLQAGVVVGDRDEAVDVTVRAAEQALTALAFEQAAGHLAWAASALGPAASTDLLLRLGDARLKAGDWDGAATTFQRAAEVARAALDAEALALAALGFGAGLGGFEVRLLDARQILLLEEAAAALDGSCSSLLPHVLARLSVALAFVDEPGRRDGLSRRAVALAERIGDPRALAYALATRADVIAGPDHVTERLTLATRVVALAREACDDEVTLLGHRLRVVALLESADIPALDREVFAFTALAERHGLPVVRWYAPLFAGMRALMRGDLDGALRLADEAERIGASAGSDNAEMLVGTLRLAVAAEQGTVAQFSERVLAMVEPLVARNPTMAGPWVMVAVMSAATGDVERAQQAMEALGRLDFASDDRDSEWLGTLTGAAQVCTALGDVAHAPRIYDLLLPYAGQLVVDGIAAACLATVDDVLAQLAVLLGRTGEARRHQAAGLAIYDRIGMPLAAARLRRLLDAPSSATATPAGEPRSGAFRRDGDLWLLAYAGREVRVADAKGLHDLQLLLRFPGQELPVTALVGGVADGPVDVLLDDTARRAYKQRLADLDEALEGAVADGRTEQASRVRAERQALIDALAEATGLAGRSRATANDHERARQAVRARIRHVLQRLQTVHPELARHLSLAVSTGMRCGYLPEHPVRWQT